jgi:hypothetical protein
MAFVRAGDLRAMNANGSNETKLLESEYANEPAWSPDGQRIAFVRAGDICIMDSDGSGVPRKKEKGLGRFRCFEVALLLAGLTLMGIATHFLRRPCNS